MERDVGFNFKTLSFYEDRVFLFMNKVFVLVFFFVCENSFCFDSLKVYHLSDVVINAKRENFSFQKIDSTFLENEIGKNVATLFKFNSGINFKSYGNFLNTISFRGLNANNTAVLLNGINITNSQNGITDLTSILNSNIEEIEISKNISNNFGVNSMSAVNFITKKGEAKFNLKSIFSFGQNGFYFFQNNINGEIFPDFCYRINFVNEFSKNDYSFYFHDGKNKTKLKRKNSSYQIHNFNFRIDSKNSFFEFYANNSNKKIPSQTTNIFSIGKSNLEENDFKLFFVNENKIFNLKNKFSSYINYNESVFIDSLILLDEKPLFNFYINRNFTLKDEIYFDKINDLSIHLGSEIRFSNITSNALKKTNRIEENIFCNFNYTPNLLSENILIAPSFNFSNYSDVGNFFSGKIENKFFLKNYEFKFSFGNSFHIPTFNDMFWKEGGNPNLKPEENFLFDFGIFYFLNNSFFKMNFETNYFVVNSRNKVIWSPNTSGVWIPKNIGKSLSTGIEIDLNCKLLNEKLNIIFNTTYCEAKNKNREFENDKTYNKYLIYQPKQTVNFIISYFQNDYNFVVKNLWQSFKYTTEINDKFLPSFFVTDISLSKKIEFETDKFVNAKIEITNLFNTDYQYIAFYPMPLREIKFQFGVYLK